MFRKRKVKMPDEVVEPVAIKYGFYYNVGIRGGSTANFSMSPFDTVAAADECRKTIIDGLTKAMSENIIARTADNIGIKGTDITWFLVRVTEEWNE